MATAIEGDSYISSEELESIIKIQKKVIEKQEQDNLPRVFLNDPNFIQFLRIMFLIFYNVIFFLYFGIGLGNNIGEFIAFAFLGLTGELIYAILVYVRAKNKEYQEVSDLSINNRESEQTFNQNLSKRIKTGPIYSNIWVNIEQGCDIAIISYKLLLFFALNGFIIFSAVVEIGYNDSEYIRGTAGLLGVTGLILEGSLIFLKYLKKHIYNISKEFLNYFILYGTYVACFIIFLVGVSIENRDQSALLVGLGLFGILLETLIIFGKFNRFTASFLVLPQNPIIPKKDVKNKKKEKKQKSKINFQDYSQFQGLSEFQVLRKAIFPKKDKREQRYSTLKKIWKYMLIFWLVIINLIFLSLILLWGIGLIGFLIEAIILYLNKKSRHRIKFIISRYWIKRCINKGIKADKYEKVLSFKKSRRKWKKALRYYKRALKTTPEIIETVYISKIVNLIQKKIGYNFLSAGIHHSSSAWKDYQAKNYQKAVKQYHKANLLVENGIKYIEKQERKIYDFGFSIDVAILYDILKLFQIIIPQIELEEKYKKKSTIYQNNLDLQEIFENLSQATQKINELIWIYNQTYILEEKYMENGEIIKLFDEKLSQSVHTYENLQDRLSYLLQYLQNLEDQENNKDPSAPVMKLDIASALRTTKDTSKKGGAVKEVEKQEPLSRPEKIKKITIVREYEYIGGKIRLKIGLVNTTGKVVTNLALRFDLPPSLKWIIHEPDYIRRGDTILIPKLGGDEKIAISLYLEPLNCLKSAINATLTYFDANDHPQAVIMPSKMVSITCPIFFTREDANLARVKSIQQKLKYNDKKIFPLGTHDNLEMIFNHLLDVIGKHDVKLVDKEYSNDKQSGEAWYYGITKVKKNKMVIYLLMDPKKHLLEVNVNGDNQEPITGLLAELEGQIREKLLMVKVISDGTSFNDINTSVMLGHCPYCNGPIAGEWISLYKKGETIACKYCDTAIIPY